MPDENKKKHGNNGQPASILDGAPKNLKAALDLSQQSDPGNPGSGQSRPGGTTSSARVGVQA